MSGEPTAADSLAAWCDAVALGNAAPAGGAVLGVVGALAASLAAMAGRLTVGRPQYAACEHEFTALIGEADALRHTLLELAERDSTAYAEVMAARGASRDTAARALERSSRLALALVDAAEVPLAILRAAGAAATLARRAAEAGSRSAAPDARVGALLAEAVAIGARATAIGNLDAAERLDGAPVERIEALRREMAVADAADGGG